MALVQCPECKKDISSTSAACPHCGFIGEPGSANYERHQLQQFQQLHQAQAARGAVSVAELAKLQRFGFPAFLSFFIPGLGQLVKGDIFRGIAFFFIAWLGVALIFAVPGLGFFIAAGFWVWNIWDAYTPG